MSGGRIEEYVTVQVSRATDDGERLVQAVRQEADPRREVPVGDPVVVGPDEELELDIAFSRKVADHTDIELREVETRDADGSYSCR